MAEDTTSQPSEPLPGDTAGEAPAVSPQTPEEIAAGKDSEIAALQKELLYQRAEFENFRKRTEKRYRDALEFATESLIKDLLPVRDNLERALTHAAAAGPEGLQALADGVGHVLAQLGAVLRNHGVEELPAQGERFDPNLHESLARVAGERDDHVAEVFEKGYLLKGRLLRPAKVAISQVAAPTADG